MQTRKSNMTTHRGHSRLWLEGKWLAKVGFQYHTPYFAKFHKGSVTLELNINGDRNVSGRDRKKTGDWTPIIDISANSINKSLGDGLAVLVTVESGLITITPDNEVQP